MRLRPLLLLVGLGLCGTGCSSSQSNPPAATAPRTAPIVVLVSIDGFRWDFIDRPGAAGLREIARLGVQARYMEPVFPTKTFPNHYSLVTGLWAEHHGIISNTMEDSALGRFTISDTVAVRDARWWGGEPMWVTVEHQGRRSASYFWPGSEAPIAGVRPHWFMRYDSEVPHDVRVRQVLEWLRLPADSVPSFITLYFSVVDGAAHRFGPDAPQTDSAITRVDSAVTALWRGIQQSPMRDRINLIVVSDHGMAATSRDRVIIVDDYLDAGSYHAVDFNPIAMLVPKSGLEDQVYQRLRWAPHLAVYRKADLPARWHFRDHPRVTPIVAVAEEGWSISTRDNFDRNKGFGMGGNHGYDNRLASMRASFLATGPAFANGKVVDHVRTVDIYALMAHVLGLRPAPNDGSLDSIRIVLR
jgi:predicted AlkP superfamily pyrophosphatase or phosphodiesterase